MTTTDITIGSVFSGIGAMDLACERHFKARTAWFCEREAYPVQVLRKRWPGVPVYDDVTTLADAGAEPVTILIGGPPCVDLSYAGRRQGLTAERSGLFFDFIAVAARMDPQPRWIVIENVPALLAEYRGLVEAELAACGAGYGVTWAKVAAAHVAGCPHLRKRVFVLAELGSHHRGVCDAGKEPCVPDAAHWPTPPATASIADGESPESWNARYTRNGTGPGTAFSIGTAVRMPEGGRLWPTPNAGNFNDGQDPVTYRARLARMEAAGNDAETQQKRASGVQAEPSRWATPTSRDHRDGKYCPNVSLDTLGRQSSAPAGAAANQQRRSDLPSDAVRWATPAASDDRDRGDVMNTPAVQRRLGVKQLSLSMQAGARLNAAWLETLQGLPPGWTDTGCDKALGWYVQHLMDMPRWPAPMIKGMWGDSPQHPFEPPRTIQGKQPNRSARIKALGNCLPPQQYLLALKLLAAGPKQASIFDLLGAA